jgi:uncharacterized membrane protein YqgA involved in biofilm formation
MMAPHSLTMTMIGASLLWVGWFGFNAGSNLEANGTAALAFINTFVAPAAAALAWLFVEWGAKGKPSMLGMVSGAVVGEILRIEDRLQGIGEFIRKRFAKSQEPGPFVTGFVTATLLFCIGPLTILGAIQDASGATPQLYIIKGTLDGFMSVIFGAVHGVGVLFSAVSVFIVQGTLTLFGTRLDALLDDRMRIELFAAGGLAVMAIGLNLLDIKKIRLGSLLPGLIITPILVQLFADNTGLLR